LPHARAASSLGAGSRAILVCRAHGQDQLLYYDSVDLGNGELVVTVLPCFLIIY
jgi:hypothetical protein